MYVHILLVLFTEGGGGIYVVLSKVYLEYVYVRMYTYIRIHNASIIVLCKAIAHTLGFLCLFFIRVKLLCVLSVGPHPGSSIARCSGSFVIKVSTSFFKGTPRNLPAKTIPFRDTLIGVAV